MPRTPGNSPFTGQSLRGMELDVKSENQGNANWACLFAATAFDVQVAAATTSRQHTLNKGSRTSTGAAGEITATCDVFVVPDSPGQWAINRAFSTGNKVDIRRCLFADQVGEDITLAASKKTFAIAAATGTATGEKTPKAGGVVTWVDSTASNEADYKSFENLMGEVEPGMTIQIGADNYFVSYRDIDGTLYIDPSPDDNDDTTPATLISGYPYIGAAVSTVSTGTLKVFRGRIQQTLYKGTVTVPVVATDAAPGDDGNDLSTAQICFALDDIGTPSYSFA